MGRFKLGSTVINLFAKDAIEFDASMENGKPTVMGTPYALKKISKTPLKSPLLRALFIDKKQNSVRNLASISQTHTCL
ncbi:phosphatidylserine decarboxylase [Vibrio sp. JCM 19053]|nr:phosphatidylserine decarboxylase [Vibrio sp. JCM 19053]